MGPKPEKRFLDDIVRDLIAPALEGTFDSCGWKLASWDAEQGVCLTFEQNGTFLLLEFEARNDHLDCYARTRRFNVCARKHFESDLSLSDADRAFVDAVVAMMREREMRLPDVERATTTRKTVVREILAERVLIAEGANQYYINPYVGCMIACPFCYVMDRADFSRRLEGLPQLPWGRYLDVKINAAEVLRREVQSIQPGIVRMSPILTDPYQPAERRYRITRQCLAILLETGFAPVVLTRAALILDDLDLLRRFPRALVGLSIPTDADAYRQIFEPGADPIEDRLATLRTFHAAGVRTFAVIQPVLPMDVDRLVNEIAPFVRAVRVDRMYAGERVQHLYDEHGLGQFATDAFYQETTDELTRAFQSRGVQVDSMDNFEPLLHP